MCAGTWIMLETITVNLRVMLIISTVVVRVVVTCVLIKRVVPYHYTLYLFHFFYLYHLNATLIYYLLQTWFVSACVKLILRLKKEIKNLTSVFLTFLKA
jgi:hypothetical protein